jgi:23S rRNA (adenine2503-C2)-methyltransferase
MNGHNMRDIKDFSYEKLRDFFADQGEKPFRAEQVMKWVYHDHAQSFSDMTNLSKALREKLEAACTISSLKELKCQNSKDGTKKFLFELADKNTIETVYMPSPDRATLCISTQVGCRMGCTFCLTAKQGLMKNLTTGDIITQVLEVQRKVDQRISNIVMMGMGEPFDNYDSVLEAVKILQSKQAFNISQRRITVSTVGLIPAILKFGQDSDVNLAISLNASNDKVRSQIMPINKKYNMAALFEACRQVPLKPTRRITFEYVMLEGLNDSIENAKELVPQIRDLKCKVNLIPFNDHPQGPFARPHGNSIEAFKNYLESKGITVTTRYSRGQDISAACGQLASPIS